MSPHNETLEQLINKHLDGEISQREQTALDTLLQNDSEARLLMTELKALHRRCTKSVRTLSATRQPAESIINRAFGTPQPVRTPYLQRLLGGPFASGLAAGLLVATLLMSLFERPQSNPPTPQPIAQTYRETRPSDAVPQLVQWPANADVEQLRDGFLFTDEQGKQWLVEGLREDTAVPVRHRTDY